MQRLSTANCQDIEQEQLTGASFDIPWVKTIWLWAERDVLLAAVTTLVFLISFV